MECFLSIKLHDGGSVVVQADCPEETVRNKETRT
jgi:hypothetical protein